MYRYIYIYIFIYVYVICLYIRISHIEVLGSLESLLHLATLRFGQSRVSKAFAG